MKNLFLILFLFFAKILLAQSVIFRTTVDKLRLRESPNLESKVIKIVEKGTNLLWLDVRSEQKITADWKGGKATDYWYKVKIDSSSSVSWVFGKGIEFFGMQFGTYENPITPKSFENQWIKFEKSDSLSFSKVKIQKVSFVVIDTINSENPYSLKFDNGTSRIFNMENQRGYWIDRINGILTVDNQSFYKMTYSSCMDGEYWLRKSDGKEVKSYILPDLISIRNTEKPSYLIIPKFAPDKKTYYISGGCTYSDNNDCGGGKQYINFIVSEFQNDETKTLFRFEELRVDYFRFINNRSGIAKMQDNSYLKITIKN